jgi:hypothetical protein
LTEPWFILVAVSVLSSVTKARVWFEDAEVKLLDTTNAAMQYNGWTNRQAPVLSSVSNPNSQLVAIEEQVDQHGCLQTPQNFKKGLDDNPLRKFQMLQSADSVLDGFT